MSDKKTFTDPKTGEEIVSTQLARLGLVTAIPILVIAGSFLGLAFGISGLSVLLIPVGLFNFVMVWRSDNRNTMIRFQRFAHDCIARSQHLRRQRLLQRKLLKKEWAGVPRTALSRAQPTGSPQPTDVALSRADIPEEEKPRLTELVEETQSADQEQSATI